MQDKIAFLFPGQGAQYLGMGKRFYDQFEAAKRVFNQADDIMGYSISRLCFEGPAEELALTTYAQVAILTTSLAYLEAASATIDLKPAYVAGHSLGEYSALASVDSLSLEVVLRLVQQRAQFMQEEAVKQPGGMAAILGLTEQEIAEICQQVEQESGSLLQIANLNCPGQIVISGEEDSLNKGCQLCIERGAKRAVRLAVSGAFHSRLMLRPGERLAQVLDGISINPAQIPVVANVNARPVVSPESIKESLIKQISSPVQWQQSITWMIEQGVNTFIEIGPGKVLSGLVKRINPGVAIKNIEELI